MPPTWTSDADEPAEQQRGDVARGGGQPAVELRGLVRAERDVVRAQIRAPRTPPRAARPSSPPPARDRRARAARAGAARASSGSALWSSSSCQPGGRSPSTSPARCSATSASATALRGRDLEHAEERPVRAVDVVVRRARADDAAAAGAGAQADVAVDAPDRRGEHPGRDARIGDQARERLALGEDVGVRHDQRAVAGARELRDGAQRAGRPVDAAHAHGDPVALRRRGQRRHPLRAREELRSRGCRGRRAGRAAGPASVVSPNASAAAGPPPPPAAVATSTAPPTTVPPARGRRAAGPRAAARARGAGGLTVDSMSLLGATQIPEQFLPPLRDGGDRVGSRILLRRSTVAAAPVLVLDQRRGCRPRGRRRPRRGRGSRPGRPGGSRPGRAGSRSSRPGGPCSWPRR